MVQNILLTGTHLTPALEFIRQLKTDKNKWDISFIGRTKNSSISQDPSIESIEIPKTNVKFFGIKCGKFDRRFLPNTLRGLPEIVSGFIKSLQIINTIKPDLIVSFGGYVSVPVVLAGFVNKIKIVSHEQTPTLSLSTKINSLFSHKIALSFPINKKNDKYILTGNLLRSEIFNPQSVYFNKFKISRPIIYFTAGNQGSVLVNNFVKKNLKALTLKYFVIHQTGLHYIKSKLKNYLTINYVKNSDIGWIFNHAALIVSRAGANTCQEIMALNLRSILIPLVKSQQNEQIKNAQIVKQTQPEITEIIQEKDLNSETFFNALIKLLAIPHKSQAKPPQINHKLLKLIKKL